MFESDFPSFSRQMFASAVLYQCIVVSVYYCISVLLYQCIVVSVLYVSVAAKFVGSVLSFRAGVEGLQQIFINPA